MTSQQVISSGQSHTVGSALAAAYYRGVNRLVRLFSRVLLAMAILCHVGWALGQSTPEQTKRTSQFEYNPQTGLLVLERIDPGLPTCVETAYSHDEYGNRKTVETRPCGSAGFEKRMEANQFSPPASQAGVAAPAPNTHRVGSYATVKEIKASDGTVLSREEAVYDVRFGTVARQTTVALADGTRNLTKHIEYDGFGRVKKEISALGTWVGHEYRYCQGPKAVLPDPACINYTLELPVDYASKRLTDPVSGALTSNVKAFALTAHYVESTPYSNANAVMGAKTRIHYDSLHREIAKETQAYDGRWTRTLTAYDQLGQVAATWAPHFANASAAELDELRQWTVARDELHRPLEQAQYVRTQAGTAAQLITVQFSYNGLESQVTVPVGSTPDGVARVAVTRKNPGGQVGQTVDAYGATLNMAYDAVGQLRKTIDALGNVTTIEYTPETSRFKEAMNDPDLGRWTYGYDALGQLKTQTDAKGQSISMTYDALGRLRTKNTATLHATWYYDRFADGTLCAAGLNRLCEATAGTTVPRKQRYAYDSKGRPEATTTTLDKDYVSRVAYDTGTGAVTTITYPTGFAVRHTYSSGSGKTPGVLERVADASNSTAVFWSIDQVTASQVFDAHGNVLKAKLGNNVQTDHLYDSISGKAFALRAGLSAGTYDIQNNTYVYDKRQNLATRTDAIAALTEVFGYDLLDRLTSYEVRSTSDAVANRAVTVAYNAIGNVLQKSDVGGYSYNASGTAQPHAVRVAGGTNYNYDANGSLLGTTGLQWRTNTWTSFNQPASLQYEGNLVEFLYDADYKRVQETVTQGTKVRTTWMVHPDNAGGLGFEREEVRTGGTLTSSENRHYISVGGVVVAVVKTVGDSNVADSSKTDYWHKDALGSVVVVTNGNGAVNGQRMAFDAWGRRIRPTGLNDASIDPTHGNRGYTGHEHLDEVALIHMNGRIYDPLSARFLSADPVIQFPEALQSYNRYSYVLNNPLKYTDPSGNCIWDACILEAFAFFYGYMATQNGNEYWRMAGQLMMAGGAGGLVEAGLGSYGGASTGSFYGQASTFNTGGFGNSFLAASGSSLISSGGDLRAAVESGVFAMAFTWAGGQGTPMSMERLALHAMIGCAQGAVSHGECGPSAIAALVGKITTGSTEGLDTFTRGTVTAVAGGTASVIGGGKFANGAFQAGFGYLFNHVMSKAATREFFSLSRGHHPFAAQWGAEYRAYISDDAIAFLGASTMGAEVRWEGDHPNKYPGENGAHREYNEHTGRRAVLDFFERNGVSAERPLTLDQARQLDTELRRLEFNREMQKYIDVQRARGRFNLRGIPKGGTGQPQD